jgi:hypothetical protein
VFGEGESEDDEEADDGVYNDLSKEPDELEPSIGPDLPEVELPEIADTSKEMPTPGEDIDRDTYSLFWRLVLVIDVALFAVAVGPMFIYFENDWSVGLPLTLLGLASFGYAVSQYRSHQARKAAEQEAEAGPTAAAGDDEPTDG